MGKFFGFGAAPNREQTPSQEEAKPGEQQQQPGQQENQEEEEFSLEGFFSEEEEEEGANQSGEGESEGEPKPKPKPGEQQQPPKEGESEEEKVTREIQGILKGLKPAEDSIPEDFDPTDPKQFRDVMATIQQQTAMTAMQATLKPMQLAFKSMAAEMKQEIQTALQSHSSTSEARQILEATIPEATDPELKGIVNNVWQQAQKKFKKPREAAAATRKALDAMGVKGKKGQSGSDPSEEGSSFLSGEGALDQFAPLAAQSKKS